MTQMTVLVGAVVERIVTLGGNRSVQLAVAFALALALIATQHGHASANFRNHGG